MVLSYLYRVQFSSVAQSCPTLCDPMDCSTPGFPVHHQLLELTQTHVHRVSDAIQPSHPLSAPSPAAFSLSQHQGLSSESVLLIRWPKFWSFSFNTSPSNEHSGLISFRIGCSFSPIQHHLILTMVSEGTYNDYVKNDSLGDSQIE